MKGRIPVLLALALALCSGFMPRRDVAPAPQPEASWPDSVKEAYLYTEGLKRLLIDGDTLAARGLLRRSLAADSSYAPAWYQLASGGMYDHPDTAVGYARRAYELDTANKWYGRLYGQMLVRGERYDEARVLYRKLLRDDPRDPDNYRILAILYQQAGMPDSAVRLLDSAELRFGKIPLLVSLKRQLLVSTGQIDRALEEAKILAEAVPYEMENRLVLGELYSMVRADSLALAEFRAAVAIDSTSVAALASLAEYYNRRHEYRAYLGVVKRLFMLDGLPLQDKVSYFRQLTSDLRFYREYFFQVDELASTLLLRYPMDKEVVKLYGEHLIASGQLDRALAHYKLHLADRPPQLDYYTMVIDIESFNKHVDSVDRYVDRAIALFPDNPELYLRRGHVLAYAGRNDEAVRSYRQSLRRADTDSLRSVVWGFIGDAYHQMDEAAAAGSWEQKRYRDASYAAYDRALAYWSNNVGVLNNYAYFLSLEGRDLMRALDMAGRVVAMTDNNPTYLDTYAWVLFKLGRLAEAKKTMQQAISLDPQNSPDLQAHYGDILFALGERFMAEVYWRKALDNGFDADEIARRLEQLKATADP